MSKHEHKGTEHKVYLRRQWEHYPNHAGEYQYYLYVRRGKPADTREQSDHKQDGYLRSVKGTVRDH